MEAVIELTECWICREMFTDPRILPCIHTFCLKCLQETASKSTKKPGDQMPCPLCRKDFAIPTVGLTALQRNIFIERMKEVAKISKSSGQNKVCEICLADSDRGTIRIPSASMYCIECHGTICERCCREHRRHRQLREHQIVALGSQIQEEQAKRFATHYCDQHNRKQVDMYCNDCMQVLCTTCFAESHQLHKCFDVNKVADSFRKQIEADLGRIDHISKKIGVRVSEIDRERLEFVRLLEITEKSIIDKGIELKELIEKHVKCLTDELATTKQKCLKEMEVEKEESERHRLVVDSFTRYCAELTSKGSPSEICRAVRDLHDRCTELEVMHKTQVQRQIISVRVSLEATDLTDLLKTENLIGKIKRSKPVNPREMQDYREMSKSSDQSRQRQVTTGRLPPKTTDGSRVDPKDDDDGYMTLLGRTASSQKNTDHLYTELIPPKEDSTKGTKQKVVRKNPENVSVQLMNRLEPSGQYAFGVTKLGDEIYVLCRRPNSLRVFEDGNLFLLRKELVINQIQDPWDIASNHALKNILFVSDRHDNCLWRVSIDPPRVTKCMSSMGDPFTLSVSSDGSLLMPRWGQPCCRLDIYSSDGVLIRTIPLSTEIQRPLHAVKKPSGEFIVTHSLQNGKVVVSEMNGGGHVTRQFQPKDQLQELNEPCHLALDVENQRLYVADWKNGRVILLDCSSLGWSQVVMRKDGNTIQQPWRLCYDDRRRQLIVGWDGLPLKVGVYAVNSVSETKT